MEILLLSIVFVASLAVCFCITPIIRSAARHWGLVDRPDGRRKMHAHPIPVAGGVAVFISASVVLGISLLCSPDLAAFIGVDKYVFIGLFLAASVIALVGIIDDYRGMRGRHKLVGQLVAVGIAIAFGVQVQSIRIFDSTIDLGILAYPVTAFWLLGAINSLNLIDGMDGLLGSIGLIVCMAIGAMAFRNGQLPAACVAVAMAGALLGFLRYNFPPASIYLGDCGSMLIGLVVGVLAIQASLKGPATVALIAPAALMIIPIFDTSAAIVRRKLTGRSIFSTDRGHMHHVLMRSGLSNHRVLLFVGVLCAFASAGALLSVFLKSEWFALGSVSVVVVILVVSRMFGHAEFLLIKERVLAAWHAIRSGGNDVYQMKIQLQGSADWSEVWSDLTECAEQLQLKTICMDVNAPSLHEGFHARWDRPQSSDNGEVVNYWRAEIPLVAERLVFGRLEVIGPRGDDSVWEKIATLAKIVEDVELAVGMMVAARHASPNAAPPATPIRSARRRTAEATEPESAATAASAKTL